VEEWGGFGGVSTLSSGIYEYTAVRTIQSLTKGRQTSREITTREIPYTSIAICRRSYYEFSDDFHHLSRYYNFHTFFYLSCESKSDPVELAFSVKICDSAT